MLFAERFAFLRTIDISNELDGVPGILVHELVPGRRHLLAVTSPRSEELDEDGFTFGHFIVILFGELYGRGTSKKCKSEENAGVHFRIESETSDWQDIYNDIM